VYSENPILFKQVLEKYKIKWVLLDESIIVPAGEKSQLFYKEILKVLSETSGVSLDKDFGEGLMLFVYKPDKAFSLYETVDSYYRVSDGVFKESDDPVFTAFGNYVSGGEDTFPFVGISDYNESVLSKYIDSDGNKVIFKTTSNNSVQYSTGNGPISPYNLLGQVKGNSLMLELMDAADPSRLSGSTLIPDYLRYPLFEIGGQLFRVDSLRAESEPAPLGNMLMSLSQNTFSNAYKEVWTKDFAQTEYSVLENCSPDVANSFYQVNKLPDGFTLTGKNLRACITMDLNKLLPGTAKEGDVVRISFDSDAYLPVRDICVFNNKRGLCENTSLSDKASYFSLKNPIDQYNVRFFADARGSGSPVSRTFKNLRISVFSKTDVFPFTLNTAGGPGTINGDNLSFNKKSGYSGKATELLSDPRPCDGKADEEGYLVTRESDAIVYRSVNKKSLCDSFWFPNVPHNTGLVLEVESKNISGSPLRICLTNEYSKRCDLYVELPENKERAKSFYLIPPAEEGAGYTVNISNMVFGNETASNAVYYLGLTPVPYEYLKSLHRETAPSTGQKLLIYNQAYEKGWLALCGLKLCKAEHVIANNWANGWIFEAGDYSGNVKVVFWPQLLEYSGLVLTVSCFIYALIRPKKH
jgi:hypothetical protein